MPFVDARELDPDTTLEADVCIVGSGPAGMALATALDSGGQNILVLESGGLTIDAQTQSLAEGGSVGVPYPALNGTRLRYFGGTANHWGGNVKPLDPIDFEVRDWIPNSGWPLTARDMAPWYERAREFCDFPAEAYDRDHWERVKGAPAWPFEDDAIRSDVFHTVGFPHLRFGSSLRDRFASSTTITTCLHFNAMRLDQRAEDGAITSLEGSTLDGKSVRVQAGRYVLAAGGIENPRLMLLSPGVSGAGIGNDSGLVGRYFMEHLTIPRFCELVVSDPQTNIGFYKSIPAPWGEIWGTLNPSASQQAAERLTNCRFQLSTITNAFNVNMQSAGLRSLRHFAGEKGVADDGPDEFAWHLANVIADVDKVAGAAWQRLRNHPDYPLVSIEVVSIGEQIPNPDSRVLLGDDLDALGQRRAVLDWQLTEQDNQQVRDHARHLAQQLGRSRHGRLVEKFPAGVFEAVPPKPHIHHMGTTRMDSNPARGVVDADCRVHGTPNLYVAGSSVFPTVGNVNPTYTIMALSARLGAHLTENRA